MKSDLQNDEAKLRKLGERLREGWKKKHPVSHRSLETVTNSVREQHTAEQKAKTAAMLQKPPPTPPKPRGLDR